MECCRGGLGVRPSLIAERYPDCPRPYRSQRCLQGADRPTPRPVRLRQHHVVQIVRLLGHDAELWKRWVFVFGKYEQLAIIAPFMPVQQPQVCPALSPTRGTCSPRLSWC